MKKRELIVDDRQSQAQALSRTLAELERARQALEESEARFRMMADSCPVMIWMAGPDRRCTYFNRRWLAFTGRTLEQELDYGWAEDLHPEDRDHCLKAYAKAFEARELFTVEYRFRCFDGVYRWVIYSGGPFYLPDGTFAGFIGSSLDITELKEAQQQLEYLANYDGLTRLPNRRLFSDRLSHALDRARRHEIQLAVMLIDLDNFKVINDTLSHDRGDRLLQAVAGRLMECVRQEDTLARPGGDEFTLLFETLTEVREVARTAERIVHALSLPFHLDHHEIIVTASIGISVYPSDGQDFQTLMKNADTAMYRAKAQGRNHYQFFTADLHAQAQARLTLETGLRRALKRGELFLLYQPLVEIATGQTVGMEALLRWQHPDLGVLLPGKFVPLAEETGLIVPIGRWVLETACRQVQAWTRAGLTELRMAVNLSPRQFRQTDLGRMIEQTLYKTGVSPSCLELELTEQAVMEDVEAASQVLHELKSLGIGLAIDDFGTGYSSLAHLKRFPLDRLKIDQTFVRDVVTDSNDAAITQAIITMAHSLKLKVLAEGVETLEQLRFLKAQGCDEAQGYYFQPPGPL